MCEVWKEADSIVGGNVERKVDNDGACVLLCKSPVTCVFLMEWERGGEGERRGGDGE